MKFDLTMSFDEGTIAAIATPLGQGGIAVIRISGKDAIAAAARAFHGKQNLIEAQSHTAHFGECRDSSGVVIDQVVATVFRAPHSYTGEDTVEISCHGGAFVTKRVLDLILQNGAHLAGPGEFTKRAFLNGRMDLAQAEAVADLIHAQSESSRRSSVDQLEGKLSLSINELRDKLLKICGLLELELDFTEEGLEFIDKNKIIQEICNISEYLKRLIESYEVGKVFRDGVKVVIVGKPNVGKSSLLNRLLDQDRAIVTDIPGTTRDVIEENIIFNGVLFKLVDTAGIRKSPDLVESEGIRRASKEVASADLILMVFDQAQEINESDIAILETVREIKSEHSGLVFVENKADLIGEVLDVGKRMLLNDVAESRFLRVSAKTGEGVDSLRKLLFESSASTGSPFGDITVITSERHKQSLVAAVSKLSFALEELSAGKSNELLAVDLRSALDSLGEIIGVVTSDDVLNHIFGKFCIGK